MYEICEIIIACSLHIIEVFCYTLNVKMIDFGAYEARGTTNIPTVATHLA